MRVVTPTASGASCVLGLKRAWAQPRRTDSSTCSATSSHFFFEIYEIFRKYLYGVFGLAMQRNAEKRDKKPLKTTTLDFC
jgi:hypothetical protein